MKLKSLLAVLHHTAKIRIVNESRTELDYGKNSLLFASLWGDKKVIMFKPVESEIYVVVEGEDDVN